MYFVILGGVAFTTFICGHLKMPQKQINLIKFNEDLFNAYQGWGNVADVEATIGSGVEIKSVN